jgi:ATP-binding cassette subfamily B protein
MEQVIFNPSKAAALLGQGGNIDQKFAALGTSAIIQATAPAIKAEYAALGMDTGKLHTNYIVNVGVVMLLISL